MNERIRELRKELKLSQAEFGAKIGVSRDTVANIEGGRIDIKDIFVKSICKGFHVNETWLRTGEGEMFVQLDPEDELMQWAGRVLAQRPEDFQKRFVKMLMGLSDYEWKILEKKVLELAGMEKED